MSILNFHKKENNLYIANEAIEAILSTDQLTSGKHRTFSLAYLYLTTWLYRYAKYGRTETPINPKMIKQLLGYNGKTVDYIIKKNGALDSIGVTEKTRNFPTRWIKNEFDEIELIDDEFSTEDLNVIGYSKRSFAIKPIHTVKRNKYPGTLESLENTTMIDFQVFHKCMTNKDLGANAFYLWTYIKKESQKYDKGLQMSIDLFCEHLDLTKPTLIKAMDQLKMYNMIQYWHQQDVYVIGLGKGEAESTIYKVNDFKSFFDQPSSKPLRPKVIYSEDASKDKNEGKTNP